MDRKEIIDYCLSFDNVYEDYPFDDNWAALRHTLNKKVFAFVYERNNKLFINLKCDPVQSEFLRSSFEAVTSAYHMNKLHWNTVDLTCSILESILYNMIMISYNLTKPKVRDKNGFK